MSFAKYGILAFWTYCAVCFFVDSNAQWFVMGRLFFWATAIAHVAEFAMFIGVLREDEDSLPVHFAKTIAFGLFHIREVRAKRSASIEA